MRRNTRAGFTLTEVIVVVLIIGVLASVSAPQYFKRVEKSKAIEALNSLEGIRGAQERYKSKYGAYCLGTITAGGSACAGFDILLPTFKYFSQPTQFTGNASQWTIVMTRNATPSVYGAYEITYTVSSSGKPTVTCNQTDCQNDLVLQ